MRTYQCMTNGITFTGGRFVVRIDELLFTSIITTPHDNLKRDYSKIFYSLSIMSLRAIVQSGDRVLEKVGLVGFAPTEIGRCRQCSRTLGSMEVIYARGDVTARRSGRSVRLHSVRYARNDLTPTRRAPVTHCNTRAVSP